MQSRFAIALMSIAGAGVLFCAGLVFGLGVMSTPKGGEHKEIAVTNAPVKVARQETTGSGDPSHDLTPLTPVHPGGPAPVQTAQAPQPQPAAPPAPAPAPAQPAPAAQAAAQPTPTPAPVAQASVQQAPQQPEPAAAPAAPAQTAAAEPPKPAEPAAKEAKATPPAAAPASAKVADAEKPAVPPANTTPVALHTKNSCDVQSCSRAYKSFRESDCTYQPFSGPRQVCVSPPAPAKEASRGNDGSATIRVRRANRDMDVENVPREGERVTDGVASRDDDGPVLRRQIRRDMAADGEDDGIDDSRVIVRRSDDRGRYGNGGWTRSFFAPVEDDDDQ